MEDAADDEVAVHLPHHIQQELCTTRSPYRQGRKLTAVKVYTVNNESQHLMIYRVPAIKLQDQLGTLCSNFGDVSGLNKLELVDPGEQFTDVYHVRYSKIRDARRAKRGMDGRSFYGSPLHVCYAPELETVEETRLKLINRRNEIAYHTGRRMKVPQIGSKRPLQTSRSQQTGKKLKRISSQGTEKSSLTLPCPSTPLSDPLRTSYQVPSTSQYLQCATVYQCPPTLYLPELKQENGVAQDFNPETSESPIVGPYDMSHSYPSQEILRLPGKEVKIARDRKFLPSSVVKKVVTSTPNRIIFHKKPPQTDAS